jgi:hypothetical protein
MDELEKYARLKKMLTQVAPGNAIESVLRPSAIESVPGRLEDLKSTSESAAAAESGLQKLAEDRLHEITPSEMFGLEAIVLPQNRPVVCPKIGRSCSSAETSMMTWTIHGEA